MARVLFFLQLLVLVVVAPLWPSHFLVPSRLIALGILFVVPVIVNWMVFGHRSVWQAARDAWAIRRLGASSPTSLVIWQLTMRVVPMVTLITSGILLILTLSQSSPNQEQGLGLLLWIGLFGLLGLTLSQILRQLVVSLSDQLPREDLIGDGAAFARTYGLTARELEVARLIVEGASYRDTADRLFIAEGTVKSHLLSVYRKTRSSNKVELLRLIQTVEQT